MLLAYALAYKASPFEGACRAFVVAVASRRDLEEVEPVKGILGKQTDRLGGIALAPTVFLTDKNADFSQAMDPVNWTQLDVTDVPVVFVQDNGQKDVIAIPLLGSDVLAQRLHGVREESAFQKARHFGVAHPAVIVFVYIFRTHLPQVEALTGEEWTVNAGCRHGFSMDHSEPPG
jgi:hypothetical protein